MLGLLVGLLIVLIGCLYFDSKKKHQYWKTRGVPFMKPLPFFGNCLKITLGKQSYEDLFKEIYFTKKDKKYAGMYEYNSPVLVSIDNNLIGNILVKDFSNFIDHGFDEIAAQTEVDEGLFLLQGSRWRAVRYKISPAFSTGKLKGMFQQMITCSKPLVEKLDKLQREDVKMDGIIKEFTMSVIASCAFGLEIDMNPESEFIRMAAEINRKPVSRLLQHTLLYLFPRLGKLFGITFTPKVSAQYFSGLIKESFAYRTKNNVSRKDFIQLLLELKQKGSIELTKTKDDEDKYLNIDSSLSPAENIEMTDSVLISQAFSFIQAGFDGLSLTIMFTLFELSINQQIQTKAREDIRESVQRHGGMTYDALKDATYFNNCVKEGLRKYPLNPLLFRKCTKRYILDDGVTIEPGTRVYIPVSAVHNDPQHYEEPQLFNPDRFLSEPKPFTYIPFGDGPRMCIAMRLALLVVKSACAVTLLNYRLDLSPKTQLPLEMDIKSFFPKSLKPILFKLSKIETK